MKLLDYQQRAVNIIKYHKKGTVYIPTGGGKTVVFMSDAKDRIKNSDSLLTIVVVAPRIILAEQLASEFKEFLKGEDISITHVHSGHKGGTTNPEKIARNDNLVKNLGKHHLIFTTYNSLEKVNISNIQMNVVYFDEAHNSTKASNQVGVAHTSKVSDHSYFFTATPKVAMNDTDVYGSNIISISAKELLNVGTILPPEVETYEFDEVRTKENAAVVDAQNITGILSGIEEENPKVLVSAPSTKIIWEAITHTTLLDDLNSMGYTVFHITSKYGAYINKKKVNRELFFEQLNDYGTKEDEKIILFHYSILSEGVNVSGLTHCIILRNLKTIEMLQTIGRVIRVNKKDRIAMQQDKIKAGQFEFYSKSCGKVIVPVSNGYGKNIAKNIQNVVDAVFIQGETLTT
jgi:superfamily II DNA or RNA helicase